ncbi:hypothetical protein [[Flexibacter] sp. ATCC 35208]|uniref:hypothetical protein n=1 Tax=[Flexibacter] sp. ATCC 35208 TaxID=1936242 RepID=UPI0009C663B4|nr:hypothetical protein [[Flexibacter] sp. ATCC 35208]OMP74702.1 hypothetical protein BW716_34015 [[Flexibacter] sp. ATCC 35208]
MKIIKTNWINIIGVFIAVFLYAIVLNLIDTNVSRNVFQSVLPALILVCLYGLVFWVLLILLLVILDLLLIVKKTSNLRVKLLIEWLIIGSPFTYWAVRYGQGIFIAGVISLLITQFIRWKHIKAVLKAN